MMEHLNEHKTIIAPAEGIYKEKGSKFLAFAHPVKRETEIHTILQNTKKMHHSAKHHCYAYQLGLKDMKYRINDDGEPSNTAGKPIYSQILKNHLTDILIIVVRYFGGKLLGVSGLINAYKTAAKNSLVHAEIITQHHKDLYQIIFGYEHLDTIMKIIHKENPQIINQTFENNKVSITLSIDQKITKEMLPHFNSLDYTIEIKYLKTII